jgi:Heterokaryon incompatibility protein (HET)
MPGTSPSCLTAKCRTCRASREAESHSQGDVIDGTISRGLIVPAYEPSSQNNIIRRRYKYRGRIVWPDGINFTLLRSWIDDCQKWEQGSHRKCGHSFSGKIHIVSRVIDCFTREMVPLTEDMEYVALSYVWGPHKATDTTVSPKEGHSDSLPCPAPKTTEDAITAALGLRRRHLWADRYCIWDSEDRHMQIQNMHRI